MKKILTFSLILLVSISMTGCLEKKEEQVPDTNKNDNNTVIDYDKVLMDALDSKEKIIDENGHEIYLTDENSDVLFIPKEYAYVDIDKNGINELVVYSEDIYGSYVILRYEDNNVYAYILGVRVLENLKEDGSFMSANGATSIVYNTISFDKHDYILTEIASYDESSNSYKINSKDVSKDEIDTYMKTFNDKKSVEFIKYEK